MKINVIVCLLVAAIAISAFTLGYQLQNGFAQNSTVPVDSTAGMFGTQVGVTIGVIASLIMAITGLLKVLPLGPLLGKYITATADLSHAIYDERMTFGQVAGLLTSMTPEEQQEYIRTKVMPALAELKKKGEEFTPKVIELTNLAAKFGKPLSTVNFGRKFEEGDIPRNSIGT